jgi:hypothetical protein
MKRAHPPESIFGNFSSKGSQKMPGIKITIEIRNKLLLVVMLMEIYTTKICNELLISITS